MHIRDEIVFHWSAKPEATVHWSALVLSLWLLYCSCWCCNYNNNVTTVLALCGLHKNLMGCFSSLCPSVCVTGQDVVQGRIVGGYAPVPHSIKHIVSIQTTERQHFCGGSLINKYWVITAAHCNIGWAHFFSFDFLLLTVNVKLRRQETQTWKQKSGKISPGQSILCPDFYKEVEHSDKRW